MIPSQMQDLMAWLLTYAVHSSVFLLGAWAIVRTNRLDHAATDIIWKVALVGGLATATLQGAFDISPAGTIALNRAPSVVDRAQVASEPLQPRNGQEVPSPNVPSVFDGITGAASSSGEGAAAVDGAPPLARVFALGWLVVASLLVLVYAGRRLVLTGRLGDRRLVVDRDLTALLETLRRETGVRAPIRLTSSRTISSPVALGAGEICLPDAALNELTPEQQRAMLAHELAHLVRRDPQWLTLACVIERALFFQPLNRLARRGLQTSAEYLADEWAARRTGGGVPLARALVKVAEWIQASPLSVPVAGFAEERSQLTVRVSRLLDRAAWAAPRSRWGIGMLAAATLVLMTAFAPGVSRSASETPGSPLFDQSQAVTPSSARAEQGDTSVVRAVISRLKDEDAEVRRAAAEALGRLGDPLAIDPLVDALADEDEDVRNAALHSLGDFERGVPLAPIRRLVDSPNAEVRSHVVQMLGERKDRASIPAITRLVLDANDEVRYAALNALEEMEAPIADELIGRVLADPSADLRQAAASVASERRMVSLVPQLIAMLEDRSADVRESAAEALTEMRTEASHRALRMAITHRDPRIRRIAVEYLGEESDK